jgi:hypothetical protein
MDRSHCHIRGGRCCLKVAGWSLHYLRLQINLLTKQLEDVKTSIQSSTYQNVYQQMIEIDRYFIENPELKAYFYSTEMKVEIPEDALQREKRFSIAEMLVDFFDSVYYQKKSMPPKTFSRFNQYMKDMYQNSVVLKKFLTDERKDWYTDKFIEELKDSKNSKVLTNHAAPR